MKRAAVIRPSRMSKTALHNPDGSLTIHIQHDRPSDDHVANWLPPPAGSFNLTMRYYTPLSSVLDQSYRLPAVRRAELHTTTGRSPGSQRSRTSASCATSYWVASAESRKRQHAHPEQRATSLRIEYRRQLGAGKEGRQRQQPVVDEPRPQCASSTGQNLGAPTGMIRERSECRHYWGPTASPRVAGAGAAGLSLRSACGTVVWCQFSR